MIDQKTRDSIVSRDNALREWMRERNTNSYKREEVAHLNPPSNEERSEVEFYDFVTNPPKAYFLYINKESRMATTWTGHALGTVYFGAPYRDNFGGRRVPVRIHARNGFEYFGTYYASAGDYARVKMCKRQAHYKDGTAP